MGIPIKGGKHGMPKGRSYAKYKPPKNNPNKNDPFRIVFYIALIAFFGWVLLNQQEARAWVDDQVGMIEIADTTSSPSGTPSAGGGKSGQGESGDDDGGDSDEADLTEAEAANLALEAYNNGDIEGAIEYYLQAAELSPNNPSYPFQAARLLIYQSGMTYGEDREDLLAQALEAAQQAQRAAPESPEGYAIAGKVLDWQGQPEQGRNQVTRALTIDENYALGHSYLAEILIDLDLPEQANEAIQTALALTPEGNVDVLRDFGYVLENQGRYDDAALQYEQALALNPRLPYLRLTLARTYRFTSTVNCNGSVEQLLAAQPQARNSPVLAFELGVTYENCLGDFPSALDSYREAVQIDDEYLSPWLRIGAIEYFNGNYPEAIAALERTVELGIMEDGSDRNQLAVSYQLAYAYAVEDQCTQVTTYVERGRALAGEDNDLILDVLSEAEDLCATP